MVTHTLVLDRTELHANGETGPVELPLGASHVLFTLGIDAALEQQSLDLTLFASVEGSPSTARPLLTFPQKFSVGTSAQVLDLARWPDVRYVQAKWKLNRWGRGSRAAAFTVWLTAEAVNL